MKNLSLFQQKIKKFSKKIQSLHNISDLIINNLSFPNLFIKFKNFHISHHLINSTILHFS